MCFLIINVKFFAAITKSPALLHVLAMLGAISLVVAAFLVCAMLWVMRELYKIKGLINKGIEAQAADSDDSSGSYPWGDETDEEFLEDQKSVDLTDDQLDRRSEYRRRKATLQVAN